jgi:hypothetical protein
MLASVLATSAVSASAQAVTDRDVTRTTTQTIPARSDAPSDVVPGVPLRQIAGGPAPLHLGEGVPAHQGDWAREAMQIAWREAPRVSGLALPRRTIPVYLFRDEEQFNAATRVLVGRAIGHGGCSAITGGSSERAIYCNAGNLDSRDEMLDYITHELTHQLIQGDLEGSRDVATWFDEGLAEVVMQRVLEIHAPSYAEKDQTEREQAVAEAVRRGNYLHLPSLTTGSQWRRLANRNLAYAEARLAVSWLVERYGMEQVVAVVRASDVKEGSFDQAFRAGFGMSVAEFDKWFAASLNGGEGGERLPTERSVSCLSGSICPR